MNATSELSESTIILINLESLTVHTKLGHVDD